MTQLRIADLRRREPFDDILRRTLTCGWTEQYKEEIRVLPAGTEAGIPWLVQPLLNAYFVPNCGERARAFLRDNFRYTSVASRFPFQWVLGTVLSSRAGLRLTGSPAFRLSASLPNEEDLLVVPGNQRIRVFDFKAGVCRVFLKNDFDPATMLREIKIRGEGAPGPFPSMMAWSEDGRWFEEPIIDGFVLARCPPNINRVAVEQKAFEVLDTWLDRSSAVTHAEHRVTTLEQAITRMITVLTARFEGVAAKELKGWVDTLANAAMALGHIPLAETHGDLQPGNILVEHNSQRIILIDWEHSCQRYRLYDHLVFGLRTRSPLGLSERLQRFTLARADGLAFLSMPKERPWRVAALALFLLEDLNWMLAESTRGPFVALSEGLQLYLQELRTFGRSSHGLLDSGAR